MEPITRPALRRLVDRAARDGEVLAVILFGSRARGDAGPRSAIDVCLVLAPAMSSCAAAAGNRLEYLSESDLDLSVFQGG